MLGDRREAPEGWARRGRFACRCHRPALCVADLSVLTPRASHPPFPRTRLAPVTAEVPGPQPRLPLSPPPSVLSFPHQGCHLGRSARWPRRCDPHLPPLLGGPARGLQTSVRQESARRWPQGSSGRHTHYLPGPICKTQPRLLPRIGTATPHLLVAGDAGRSALPRQYLIVPWDLLGPASLETPKLGDEKGTISDGSLVLLVSGATSVPPTFVSQPCVP